MGQEGVDQHVSAPAHYLSVCVGETMCYAADTDCHTIRKVDLKTGLISTVAGSCGALPTTPVPNDGPISGARFVRPIGLAVSR